MWGDFFSTNFLRFDIVGLWTGDKVTKKQTLDTHLKIFKANSHTGTTQEIVTLSLGIAQSYLSLDASVFSLYKEKVCNPRSSSIGDKVFSKLKTIGLKLLEIDEKKRRDVIEQLPPSYSTIQVLCSLTPEELVTATKSKVITKKISIRSAKAYIQQIKFPRATAMDGEKGRWGHKQEHLYSVMRPDDVSLGGEVLLSLEGALRRVCTDYGVTLQHPKNSGAATLRKQERTTREQFWRSVLQKELTTRWFNKMPDMTKKQFNLRNVQELHEAPLRSFTGFIINATGSRDVFWEKHSEAYIAKLNMLMEGTEDAAQRYNYRRRKEEVIGQRTELAIWNNVMMKEGGFV